VRGEELGCRKAWLDVAAACRNDASQWCVAVAHQYGCPQPVHQALDGRQRSGPKKAQEQCTLCILHSL